MILIYYEHMRKSGEHKPIVVAVSGGFDPIHIGHVRLFERARALGDKLVVILNNDNWLRAKKHHIFMPQEERAKILRALRVVDDVVISGHGPNPIGAKAMSVSAELAAIKPDIFANGGDRDEKNANDPGSSLYHDVTTCKALGIEMVFNIGAGGKIQSSSWLLADYAKKLYAPEEIKKFPQEG